MCEQLSDKEINHLDSIYGRMVYVLNQSENVDYMLKFKEIIHKLKPPSPLKFSWTDGGDVRDEFHVES